MGVLDGGGDRRRGRGSFGMNFGRPIATNGNFATRPSQITLGRTCSCCCCARIMVLLTSAVHKHDAIHKTGRIATPL